jgi:hypothetical protein
MLFRTPASSYAVRGFSDDIAFVLETPPAFLVAVNLEELF